MNADRESRRAEALAWMRNRSRGNYANKPWPLEVAAIRRKVHMTQERFAARFGFSVATLRHWEHGSRKPRGPALVLLNVIARNPRAVLHALADANAAGEPCRDCNPRSCAARRESNAWPCTPRLDGTETS